MGRPPTKPVTFRDGFYVEVLEKGATRGIKIRSNTEQEMLEAAELYRRNKVVLVLGQMRKGVWLNEAAQNAGKQSRKEKAAAAQSKAAENKTEKTLARPVVKAAAAPAKSQAPVKKAPEKARAKAPAKAAAKPVKKAAAKKK